MGPKQDWRAQIAYELYPCLITANLPNKSAPRVRETKHRCKLFREGRWEQLFEFANRPPPPRPTRSNAALSELQTADRKAAQAATAALNLGSVSKASQALSNPNLGVNLNPVLAAETLRKMNPVPGTTACNGARWPPVVRQQ